LSSEYKHTVNVRRYFDRALRSLDRDLRERVLNVVDELQKGTISGKPLKGPYREFKSVRIGKYRLIYSDKVHCVIDLHDIRHRESAYI
jgi:mRNA-degrading endonuclease RelE of RelBE toxin-antitoxin system